MKTIKTTTVEVEPNDIAEILKAMIPKARRGFFSFFFSFSFLFNHFPCFEDLLFL